MAITLAKISPTTSIASMTSLPSSAAVFASGSSVPSAIAARDSTRPAARERRPRARTPRVRRWARGRRESPRSPPRPLRLRAGRPREAARSARSARPGRLRPPPSPPPQPARARGRRGSRRAGARCRRRPVRTAAGGRSGAGSPRRSSPTRARTGPRRAGRTPPRAPARGWEGARRPTGGSPAPPRPRSSPRDRSLQPARELLRPVRDDEVGSGPDDRRERLQRRLPLVQPAAGGGRLDHCVLAGDVVGAHGKVEALAHGPDHVEVRERRLDHHGVRPLPYVQLALAERL